MILGCNSCFWFINAPGPVNNIAWLIFLIYFTKNTIVFQKINY